MPLMGNLVQPLGILVPPIGIPVPPTGILVSPLANQVLPMGKPVPGVVLLGQPVAKQRPHWGRQAHQGGGDGTPGGEMHSVPRSLTQYCGIVHQSLHDSRNVCWERALSQLFQPLN